MYSQYIMLVPADHIDVFRAAFGDVCDGPRNGFYYACGFMDPNDYGDHGYIEWHECSGGTKKLLRDLIGP